MSVLIVDDCPATRQSLRSLLEARGIRDVLGASSGEEALETLNRQGPGEEGRPGVEVVLMDVEMAGLDGIETCKRIKAAERLRDIPVLIITGNTRESALEAAFEAGACDYLAKPVQPGELLARLRSALNLRHQIDDCKAREHELMQVTRRLEQANAELQRLAVLDELTGIANRRFFNILLAQEWARAAREVQPLALALIDIDHFKDYNDHYGHQMGDECLRRVASALSAVARRPGDHVARYGGEEFAVVMPHTGLVGAAAVAERIRARVEALGLEHPRACPGRRVTVSLGVACAVPERCSSPDLLVTAADRAVYQAKHEGRNRVAVFEGLPERAAALQIGAGLAGGVLSRAWLRDPPHSP